MGVRKKINRLLCVPCTIMLWTIKNLKNGSGRRSQLNPLRTAILLLLMIIIITLLVWSISHSFSIWILNSLTRHVPRSFDGEFPTDDSFLLLYKNGLTGTNTLKNRESNDDPLAAAKSSDKFSRGNFLHLKLQHLVALGYLTSPFQTPEDDKSNRQLLSNKHGADLMKTNFTFLLNELNIAIKVQNFYLGRWGCPEIAHLKFPNHITKTQHTMTGNIVYHGKNIALQSSIADVDELMSAKCGSADSDKSRDNENRCFLMKNRRMLQQYLFLSELSHPNIAKLFGVCISTSTDLIPGTFTLAKEAGITADITKLQSQSWSVRLKLAYDLVNLAIYLAKSPVGSILLETWSPDDFFVVQDSSTAPALKLSNLDQKIVLTEKVCRYDRDCSIGRISSATKCTYGLCMGYNEKYNLHKIYKSFLYPLLEAQVPSRISADATKVFNTLKNLQCNSTVLLQLLRFLQPSSDNIMDADDGEDNGNFPLHEALNRHPDGLQVDSWEQHESHIAINEVDFNQLPDDQNNAPPDMNNAGSDENEYKETFGYKKIENADYPGRYDYYCPHSKAEWGCVVSLRKLEEAAKKCDEDVKCKAFVTMPHLRKEGWIIVILKSDNTRAVDHAGTTVYIKPSDEIKAKKEKESADGGWSKDSGVVKLCLQDLVQAQESIREKREKQMMKICGWEGMSDTKWQSAVLETTVSDATKFKPSRGKMAVGGQMDVILDSSSKPSPALFMAKKGPEEFHLAQLTTYHLDRMLGLYKILPAFLRTLTEQEMADAGFPVDIGGNQFDMFRQLKNADKSLSGSIIPMIGGRIGVEHYISVPKLGQITNAVTPFSRRQWDDIEYLLLMWLASLPMPTKGHPSLQGHLIHIKADEAFKSEPSADVLSYFYNCHFPRIAIDVLRNLRSAHCNFGDQLIARLRTAYPDLQVSAFSFQVPVADIATRNANRLLEVVDLCVRKFGDSVVLYDS